MVDTSIVYPHRLGPPYKKALKTVSADVLQKIIQEDGKFLILQSLPSLRGFAVDGHDSKEDASICMQLMLHKTKSM